ncbi:hypothetical protein K431DRAFT_316818 [Polychaeton citri CBS 116435]|uniref:Uncharacterized protein n=1 Tax=Polychaeton citri CBS 116435 TaxID=1314669 RepID=A0A9P4Q0X2_9PEZI|nr:hypothetical protein K431DRAFT_316818 [Polychaeton citri CBS 116435]
MIPVVCTAPLNAELINEFLVETYDNYPEAAQSLVILTTLDWTHYDNDEAQLTPDEARKQKSKVFAYGGGPMKVPSRPLWTTNFSSPFEGKAPEDVARFLKKAEDAPGHLDRRYCAILDKQSEKDRSVLLVKTKRSEGDNLPSECKYWEIVKLREEWKEANAVLQSASVGVSSLEEILWNQYSDKQRS